MGILAQRAQLWVCGRRPDRLIEQDHSRAEKEICVIPAQPRRKILNRNARAPKTAGETEALLIFIQIKRIAPQTNIAFRQRGMALQRRQQFFCR